MRKIITVTIFLILVSFSTYAQIRVDSNGDAFQTVFDHIAIIALEGEGVGNGGSPDEWENPEYGNDELESQDYSPGYGGGSNTPISYVDRSALEEQGWSCNCVQKDLVCSKGVYDEEHQEFQNAQECID